MKEPNVRTILVTTDLSPEAAKAYPYAALLADRLNASIRLVTFLDNSVQMGIGGPFEMPVIYVPEAVDELKKRLTSDLAKEAAEHFSSRSVTTEIHESTGAIHYSIVDYVEANPIDMVIMASHGRSGLSRTILGSVAEGVLRRAKIPVMVIPVRE